MQAPFFTSRVVRNRKLNDKFRLVTFKIVGAPFSFIPGQYVALRIPPSVFRCYSIFSVPSALPVWEMFVDITPGGPGTTFIRNLKKGDTVETLKPSGDFTYRNDSSTRIIFAATGCGLAPYRPMIESVLRLPHKPDVLLLWGLRHQEDIAVRDILDAWTKKYPHFRYDIVLSQPERAWRGKTGHVNTHLAAMVGKTSARKTSVYLCGNGDFVQQNFDEMKKFRFPKKRVYFENY